MTVDGSIPDWLNPVPFGDVGRGQLPGDPQQWDVMSEDQLQQMRLQLIESILSSVVQAVRGLFFPGPFGAALEQLVEWATTLLLGGDLLDAINGEYEGDNLVLQLIEVAFLPLRLIIRPLAEWLSWLWKLFANVTPNPAPTGPGADLLVPIFEWIDWLWERFGEAVEAVLKPVLRWLDWLWRLFANVPGPNPAPTGPGADILVPIFEWLDWLWERFGEAVEAVLKPVFEWLDWLWRLFANTPGPNPEPTGPGANILVPLFKWLDGVWEAFGDVVEDVFAFVMDIFKPMAPTFNGDVVGTVIKEVVEFFNGIINTFGSIAEGLPSFADLGQTILSLINSITGGFADAIADGLASVINLFATIPVLGNLINAIIPPESQWRNPITAQPASSLADLRVYANELIRTDSVVYSQNLQGPIPADLLPVVSPGSVGNTRPNLVADAGFRSAAAVQDGEGWSWDAVVSRTAGDGGSAKVVCDGGTKQMFSNLVAVSPGQELECSVWARWTKPFAARPTISVGLRGYVNDAVVFTQPVSARTNIVENSSSFSGNVSGWVEAKGTYLIPDSQPLTHVRLVLSVMNAPAGTSVWFDEAALRRVSLIRPSLVAGVADTSNSLADDIENAVGIEQYDDLLRAISRKTGYTLADVQATVEDFLDGDSQISGDQIKAGDISVEYIKALRDTWDTVRTGIDGPAAPLGNDLAAAFAALSGWRNTFGEHGTQISDALAATSAVNARMTAVRTEFDLLKGYVQSVGDDVRRVTIQAGLVPSTPPTVPGAPAPTFASVRDDFNRTTLGSNWAVSTRISNYGTLITDGKNAKFDMPAFDGFLTDARRNVFTATYIGVNSLSVYQRVYLTLGSAPGRPAIGPAGYNDLIGRAKSGVICIVARFYNDAARTVKLFWRNGAYETDPFAPANTFATFARPSTTTLGAGTNLEFVVGSKAASDASKCSVKIGSWVSPVYTSTAALSVLGNGWGFGGGNGNSSTSVQWPGTVDSWGAEDQQ